MRVALDTNVLVSAVATRGLCAEILHMVVAEHQLVIGETVLSELRRVLERKIRVREDVVDEMDAFLRRHALLADRVPKVMLEVRDPSDLRVIAEAVGGGADVLVTGDRDLLDVAGMAPIPIVSPRGFWDRLRLEP